MTRVLRDSDCHIISDCNWVHVDTETAIKQVSVQNFELNENIFRNNAIQKGGAFFRSVLISLLLTLKVSRGESGCFCQETKTARVGASRVSYFGIVQKLTIDKFVEFCIAHVTINLHFDSSRRMCIIMPFVFSNHIFYAKS
jgi:hypothetical protein